MVSLVSTTFGQVVIDGRPHGDVLVVGTRVVERDRPGLKERYGTSHVVGDAELDTLLANGVEDVVIGTGQSGVLEVAADVAARCAAQGVDLVVERTPRAIETYNRLAGEGRRVNALLHTTC